MDEQAPSKIYVYIYNPPELSAISNSSDRLLRQADRQTDFIPNGGSIIRFLSIVVVS